MGFYGNITNTSKTTFSFDLIYPSRSEMDSQANKDGVFLGRYVLVDYGEDPIKGYFNPKDSLFYHTPSFTTGTAFYGKEGTIYQDINNTGGFYRYDINQQIYVPMSSKTPYQERFQLDVKNYGRGYDSTAWVKRYDPTANDGSGGYKYVAIAELNAVVPTFHMVVNKPNASPVPPYFDRDTTNIDYYLHMQGNFSTRVKEAQDNIKSDEMAIRTRHIWEVDESGYQDYTAIPEEVRADIYFNNAGFDEKIRYYDTDKVTYNLKDDKYQVIPGSEPKEIDYSKNTIGYDMGRSTRLYGNAADMGTYEFGTPADDIYDWYVRLPGIGNAICKMWDKVYDNRDNKNLRALNKALKREDTDDHLVTYNKSTVMGMLNTTQDLLGYYFIPIGTENHIEGNEITSAQNVTIELIQENGVASYTATYPVLSCLFYDKPEGNAPVKNYYHYKYDPTYTEIIPEDPGKDYYYQTDDGLFRRANISTYGAVDANGNKLDYDKYYERHDRWILTPLEYEMEDSIYALIAAIHNLMGTNADDVRNIDTMKGAINTIKDIISNIDLRLSPGKLLHTNNQGIIETTDTYFPAADWNKDKILDGNGDWVSRFASVKILNNSDNANQKAPKVNIITNGTEQNVNKTIVSDNDKTNYGTSLVNNKKHTTNNLTLGTRNKWIELYGDEVDDSVEFKHSTSPVISRLHSEQAAGIKYLNMYTTADENGNAVLQDSTGYQNFKINNESTEIRVEPTTDTLSYVYGVNDQDDNRLTIPYLTVDNAGHVVELGTKNFNIPHTYKHITLTEQSNSEDFITPNDGNQEADLLADRLTFSTGNQWVEARIEDDKIIFAHALIKDKSIQKWEFKPTAFETDTDLEENQQTEGWENSKKDGNELTIPNFAIDNAGHIVKWGEKKFYIPNNFRSIKLDPQSYAENAIEISNEIQEPNSLNDTFSFATGNRWIEARTDEDKITYSHKLVPNNTLSSSVPLNGDRKTNVKDIETVYRYGLPQDKSISMLDRINDNEAVNTFNVPYIEVDKAGHVVAAETHTVTLPHNYESITIGAPSTNVGDLSDTGTIGETSDDLASLKPIDLKADTLTGNITLSASNKWIRIKGHDDVKTDTITIGHELHNIIASEPHITDLEQKYTDENKQGSFTTQTVQWDNAGHIIGHHTETWKLPYSLQNINVTTAKALNAIEDNDSATEIKSIKTSDSFNFKPANNWIRLQASNHDISFGHLIQGTAGSYTGTDISFIPNGDTSPRFGESVTLYGYTTDEAGHVIGYPEYTLTLPKGSYKPDNNDIDYNGARVITSIGFTASSGKITSTSQNVGTLKLNGYTQLEATTAAVITADNTINEAFAVLDNRIDKEERTRDANISNLRMFKTIQVIGSEQFDATSNADTMAFNAGNDAIQINSKADTKTITISHAEQLNLPKEVGLYKIAIDGYGHITSAAQAEKSDIGLSNVDNMSVKDIIESITSRFSMSLNQPILSTTTSEDESGKTFTVNIDHSDADSEYEYKWFKNNNNLNWTKASYTVKAADNEESGTYTYRCEVTRTYAGVKSSSYKEFTYTVEEKK